MMHSLMNGTCFFTLYPGSSSLLGFLQEEGPLLINAKGGLMDNPYSWTKYVNLVAIEAPVGVGYSYCSRQLDEGKPCQNTDRLVYIRISS